jgi:hypothetical protein
MCNKRRGEMEIVLSPEAPNELNDALPWLIMGIK